MFFTSRFQKGDMFRLHNAFQIPEFYICKQRTKATGTEALMILLRRLSYPNRLCDLEMFFGRSETELSLIINTVQDVYDHYISHINIYSTLYISPNHIFTTLYVTVFYCTLSQILDDHYDRFHHLIDSLDLVWLDPEIFSKAIHAKGAPLTQCWGFIDGTQRPIARPIHSQKVMYSGHKRIHC